MNESPASSPSPISLLRQLHPLTFTKVECACACWCVRGPLVMWADGKGEYKCEGREERMGELVNFGGMEGGRRERLLFLP